MSLSHKPLEIFFKSLDRLATTLDLQSQPQRLLLAIELATFLLVAFFVAAFLAKDLIVLIAATLSGTPGEYSSFKVFLVSMVVVSLSIIAIMTNERWLRKL